VYTGDDHRCTVGDAMHGGLRQPAGAIIRHRIDELARMGIAAPDIDWAMWLESGRVEVQSFTWREEI
jgi:hypothetical protein